MFIRSSGTPETWSGWKWVRIRSVMEWRLIPTRPRRSLCVLTQSIRTTPSAPTSAMWVFSWSSSGMAFDVPSKTNRAIGSTPEEDPDGDQRGKEDFDRRRHGQQRDDQPDHQARPLGEPGQPVVSERASVRRADDHHPPTDEGGAGPHRRRNPT